MLRICPKSGREDCPFGCTGVCQKCLDLGSRKVREIVVGQTDYQSEYGRHKKSPSAEALGLDKHKA